MIRVYDTGVTQHIFEVDREELRIGESGIMETIHYEVVPGSLAYFKKHKICYFKDSFSVAYPKDDCREPTKEEMSLYESAKGI